MTAIVDTETGQACLITSLSEVGARSGGIGRALGSGALVLVDDNRVPCRAYLMVPPQLIPRVLEFLGVDPAAVPEPGSARDAV